MSEEKPTDTRVYANRFVEVRDVLKGDDELREHIAQELSLRVSRWWDMDEIAAVEVARGALERLPERESVARSPSEREELAEAAAHVHRDELRERLVRDLSDRVMQCEDRTALLEVAAAVRERLQLWPDGPGDGNIGEHARERHGYELLLRDGGQWIAVLEHADLGDRVAVARTAEGRWVYADVREYTRRGPEETAERAFERLRECIVRSPSKGGMVEFNERVDGLTREWESRLASRLSHGDWDRVTVQPPHRSTRGQYDEIMDDPVEGVQYVHGYKRCRRDGGKGISVLEHAGLGDRVAVAEMAGRFIYADVREYVPRRPDESAEHAFARLRDCIERSPSNGGMGEFSERVHGLKRDCELRQWRSEWDRVIAQAPGRGTGDPEIGR